MPDSNVSIIVFALLAVFVIWKLRSVLGTRTGHERPPYEPFDPGKAPPSGAGNAEYGKILRLPTGTQGKSAGGPVQGVEGAADRWARVAKSGSEVWKGLDQIAALDPTFDPEAFLKGATSAYEMIVVAYAAGDLPALEKLLSSEVLTNFQTAIHERTDRGEKMETTIVSIDRADLEDVRLIEATAHITVRFLTKTISCTRANTGEIIEGSPDQVIDHTDLWTFARPPAAPDPNWLLVATQSAV